MIQSFPYLGAGLLTAFLLWKMLAVLLNLTPRSNWWWPLRDADEEQLQGLGVIVLVLLAGLSTVALAIYPVAYFIRIWVPLLGWTAAFLVASGNWTRRVLRRTAVIALLAIGAVFFRVGSNYGIASEATAARDTVQALSRRAVADDLTTISNDIQKARIEADKLSASSVDLRRTVLAELEDAVEVLGRGESPEAVDVSPLDKAGAESTLNKAISHIAERLATKPVSKRQFKEALAQLCPALDETQREGFKECAGEQFQLFHDTDPVSLATLRLRLAKFKQVVLGRDEDKKAVEAAEAALIASITSPEVPKFAEVLGKGAEAMATSIRPNSGSSLVPDVTFWAIFLSFLYFLWRAVERTSAQKAAGPVSIGLAGFDPVKAKEEDAAEKVASKEEGGLEKSELTDPTSEETKDVQERVFKVALLLNLREPSTVPRSASSSSLTDLIELPDPVGKPLGALVKTFRDLFSKEGGYLVKGELIDPSGKAGKWRVLIRVMDQWSGEQTFVGTASGVGPKEACRTAGFMAAAVILERSPRIPSWARWDKATAQGLAANHADVEPSVEAFEAAVSRAPASGVLLTKLGDEYSIKEQHTKALMMYARAVAAHPRFLEANYRMAIGAGLVAREPDAWCNSPISERKRTAEQLQRASDALFLGLTLNTLAFDSGENVKRKLLDLADEVLARLERSYSFRQVAARALRRSERAVWWPMLTSPARFGRAGEIRWLMKSARLTTCCEKARATSNLSLDQKLTSESERVGRVARDRRSDYGLSYNLACFHARRGQADQACTWLETSLQHPESVQMSEWIGKDPDLKALHGNSRFEWVISHLSAAEKEGLSDE